MCRLFRAGSIDADDRKIWNDAYTKLTAQKNSFLPNSFLTKIVEGKTPGKAVDVAMGQGWNALMLAERGDISDVAIDQAKALAQSVPFGYETNDLRAVGGSLTVL